jgi:tRNA pseudouridine38-40 synthase
MSRFFIEVAYKGTNYSGFQVQQNAVTIQSELEKAMTIFFREPITLTGSSRTDAGVNAKQNFFHFDLIREEAQVVCNATYNINAILPEDIAVLSIVKVKDNAHCRFDALSRMYQYTLYNKKDPFLTDYAYYYPYQADLERLNKAAVIVLNTINFETFCKKNVQIHHYDCKIEISEWAIDNHKLIYTVKGNRFLRGMVRGLVGTMLRVGAKKINLEQFETIVASKDVRNADFSMPARGLSLIKVSY